MLLGPTARLRRSEAGSQVLLGQHIKVVGQLLFEIGFELSAAEASLYAGPEAI